MVNQDTEDVLKCARVNNNCRFFLVGCLEEQGEPLLATTIPRWW